MFAFLVTGWGGFGVGYSLLAYNTVIDTVSYSLSWIDQLVDFTFGVLGVSVAACRYLLLG